MKVLSILQPWATLVVIGAKKIETRSWNTKFRGPLLIHASQRKIKLQEGMFDLISEMEKITGFMDNYKNLPYGAIIGKVDIISTESSYMISSILRREQENWRLHPNREFMNKFLAAKIDHESELVFGDYSPSRYGWLLSDAVEFANPIPAKGALSIWNYDLPDHFHLPVKGGLATFDSPPTKETVNAVNKMADLAFNNSQK